MNDDYKKVMLLGSKRLGLEVLRQLTKMSHDSICGFVTIDDTDDTRSCFTDIQAFCEEQEIPLCVAKKNVTLKDIMQAYKPDICFVAGWYSIIPTDILDEVPMGFIGIHYSLLPAYRGNAPLVWQMINGETTVGYSVFSLSSGMDEGDIWHQGRIRVYYEDYVGDVLERIEADVIDFLSNHYFEILTNRIKPYKQSVEGISYTSKRTPEDGMINWNNHSKKIYDFVRAQSKPYPGAFTYYRGKKITIWKASEYIYPIYGNPGQIGIIDKDNKNVVIVCGDGTGIEVHSIDIDGRKYNVTDIVSCQKYRFGK